MTHPLTLVRTPDTGPADVPRRSSAGRPPLLVVSADPAPTGEALPAAPVAAAALADDDDLGSGAPTPNAPASAAPASAAPATLTAPTAATDHDAGMSTVEYAVGTVVAAAFAAVLYRIVTGDSIVAGLTSLVQSALNTGF